MKSALIAGVAAAAVLGLTANAQQYVRGSAGLAIQGDSDNSGAFNSDFQLGVLADTTVPNGSGVGWTTEFDDGLFVSGAYGLEIAPSLRVEAEISYNENDVDTHSGVTVEGFGNIDTLDAGILLGAAQTTALGTSVGDLVADGQGSISTLAFMVNGYYDIDFGTSPFSGYAGLGLGFGQVDVEYAPSGVGIIDDDSTVFLYQVMVGAEYLVAPGTTVYGGYRYRDGQDVETDVDLFPAELDIENNASIVEVGVRYSF